MKIYHNNRCSKSRATLEILKNKGVSLKIINYLKTPPSKDELKNILKLLNKFPTEIIRFNESIAKKLNISKADVRDIDEWLDILIKNPILIERPIVVHNSKAVIGRPPERVLTLF